MLMTILLALLVVNGVAASTSNINNSRNSNNNSFRVSSYFQDLAKKINMYPNLPWRAAFGPLKNLDNEGDSVFIKINMTSNNINPGLTKRQIYSPVILDWRSTGKLAEPEHQGACGSCWAFASVHTMMDNFRIHNSITPYLSTQHVLECCVSRACGGCSGASDNAAGFDFLSRKYTIESHCKNYAYHRDARVNRAYSQPGQQCSDYCDYPNTQLPLSSVSKYSMTDFVRLDSDVHQIKNALTNGPLLAAVQLFGDLYLYQSGIYRHVDGPPLGYHSVEMVGYGSEMGQGYWIIKNSWGQEWGEKGYFRIVAGNNEAKIEDHVIQPIFSGQRQDRGYDEAFLTPVGGSSEADTNNPEILDVAYFVAREIKPICSDGRLDNENLESIQIGESYHVERVLQASTNVVGGIIYNIKVELSLPRCSKLMYVQAKTYLPSTKGVFELQHYEYIPAVNRANVIKGCVVIYLVFIVFYFIVHLLSM